MDMIRCCLALLTLATLSGCSREQTLATASVVADSYQTSYRNNVIQNWQAHLVDSPECASFKDQMKTEGEKFDSAATGGFVVALQNVKAAAKAAGCVKAEN